MLISMEALSAPPPLGNTKENRRGNILLCLVTLFVLTLSRFAPLGTPGNAITRFYFTSLLRKMMGGQEETEEVKGGPAREPPRERKEKGVERGPVRPPFPPEDRAGNDHWRGGGRTKGIEGGLMPFTPGGWRHDDHHHLEEIRGGTVGEKVPPPRFLSRFPPSLPPPRCCFIVLVLSSLMLPPPHLHLYTPGDKGRGVTFRV